MIKTLINNKVSLTVKEQGFVKNAKPLFQFKSIV